MTPAERQRRRRERIKAAQPPRGSELAFRRELWRFIEATMPFYPELCADHLRNSLEQVGTFLAVRDYMTEKGEPERAEEWLRGLLAGADRPFTKVYQPANEPDSGHNLDTAES